MQNDIVSAQFWDTWNFFHRQPDQLTEVSKDQQREIIRWCRDLGLQDAKILEVGCGTGWLCQSLLEFGHVEATDLSPDCIRQAQHRLPQVHFVAGDFSSLEFPAAPYDIVCTLEVLAHVEDQNAFIGKIARLLKPGGTLMLATQNRRMLERWAKVAPPPLGSCEDGSTSVNCWTL
ncbi:class I SAM-dependent methyltransferase [Rhodopseudomonas palustris]|uniref:Class I SAM-dependent methyltransferase n=1 Tax=Rhodopseudomonas palustris TaxID=1076 RepID=A0AAX3DUH7_RHOPL|nr:class I SAM-dependent methyltransferase [Rhodopseudomonas palustris]UYO38488.1 class I SAM-dependent methyltransferase [Rhodopseudomonas palustris]